MALCEFIEKLSNIDKKEGIFITPKHIEYDSKYFAALSMALKEVENVADEYSLDNVVDEIQHIKDAISLYCNGEIVLAIKEIEDIVKELVDSNYIVTNFNDSGAFNNYDTKNCRNDEVDLYRARTGVPDEFEDKYAMYHIPFNMRERIGSQRFSVPGVPCLYLGKSVYTCWRELGQPNDSEFYVSRARINNEIKIFNMAVNFDTLRHFCNCKDLKDNENFLYSYVKVWILSFACSFKVKQYNRQFKSEYIVPQLLMLSLKKRNTSNSLFWQSFHRKRGYYKFCQSELKCCNNNGCAKAF